MDITKIRREVAIMANRFNRKFHNLSLSFKKAWAIVKANKVICKVAGVTFGSRQEALKRIERYQQLNADIKVTLSRDAENSFDSNAIKVNVFVNGSKAYHLGFIPKETAHYLAPVIDKLDTLKATLVDTTGGYGTKYSRGCIIAVEFKKIPLSEPPSKIEVSETSPEGDMCKIYYIPLGCQV